MTIWSEQRFIRAQIYFNLETQGREILTGVLKLQQKVIILLEEQHEIILDAIMQNRTKKNFENTTNLLI